MKKYSVIYVRILDADDERDAREVALEEIFSSRGDRLRISEISLSEKEKKVKRNRGKNNP